MNMTHFVFDTNATIQSRGIFIKGPVGVRAPSHYRFLYFNINFEIQITIYTK